MNGIDMEKSTYWPDHGHITYLYANKTVFAQWIDALFDKPIYTYLRVAVYLPCLSAN